MTDISMVMPAYNEEDGVAEVVRDCLAIDRVDEVVVADNNSTDATASRAEDAGARVVTEPRQGYGYAMHRALTEASGDIVVSIESDMSYVPSDIHKLLAYADDADIVLGDRTNTALIEPGAKMGPFLRYGNKLLGRLIQVLHDGPRITDVGCSFRLFHRDALDTVLAEDVAGPDRYSPQLIMAALHSDLDIVLVPVTYRERVGESTLTTSISRSTRIGLNMASYIIARKLSLA